MRHFTKVMAVLIFCAGMASMLTAKTRVTQRSGGKLPDGSEVTIYNLKNEKMEVEVMNYGGYVLSIKTPDRSGKVADIVLGFDDPS
ncbi:MAG TPA: hypothetical protein VMH89_10355, partial [Candidatus Acidoferrum sp.]|nr:hypothetical protein [Candidatus Acidoferrum sp.]